MEKKNIFAKFSLKWALAAMLIVGGGFMTGCKNYDDEIDKINEELAELQDVILAIQGGKLVEDVVAIEGGYRVLYVGGGSNDLTTPSGALSVKPTDDGNGWVMTLPGGGTLTLPKTITPLVGLVLIPESLDQTLAEPALVFGSLVMKANTGYGAGADALGEYANKQDTISGLSEIRFLVNPSTVVKGAIQPKDFLSKKVSDGTPATNPEIIDLDIADWDLVDGELIVYARQADKTGEDAATQITSGIQDRVSLQVQNMLDNQGALISSEFVPARVNPALVVDSALVRSAGDVAKKNVALFAYSDAEPGSLTFASNTPKTGMQLNPATSAPAMYPYTADAGTEFLLELRAKGAVKPAYITGYDFSKHVAAYVGDEFTDLSTNNANYDALLSSKGFTPEYLFDTLTTTAAAANSVIDVTDAGMMTFRKAVTADNVGALVTATTNYPSLYAKVSVSDDEDTQEVVWGALNLDFTDTPATAAYKFTTSTKIRTYLQDTIWAGSLTDMLAKTNGITEEEFFANYQLGTVTSFAQQNMPTPKAGRLAAVATGDLKTAILKDGKFGIIIDSMAQMNSGTDFYQMIMTFTDKVSTITTATHAAWGTITATAEVTLQAPDVTAIAWTPNNAFFTDNMLMVNGKENATPDAWLMQTTLTDKFTKPASLTENAKAGTPVVAVDLMAWEVYEDAAKTTAADTVTITGDVIELPVAEYQKYINLQKPVYVNGSVALRNHGGVTRVNNDDDALVAWGHVEGGDKTDAGSATVTLEDAATTEMIQQFQVKFGQPVIIDVVATEAAPLQIIGADGASRTHSLYLLNALRVTNHLKGTSSEKVLIKPSANAETTQAVIDSTLVDIYGVATAYVAEPDDYWGPDGDAALTIEFVDAAQAAWFDVDDQDGKITWVSGTDVTAPVTVGIKITLKHDWNDGSVAAIKPAVQKTVFVKVVPAQ